MLCPSCASENPSDVEICFSCGRHLTALTQGSIVASRYEILSLLGKGGMGMVYKAADRLLDETVAIKVLRNEFVGTQEMGQRFRSEIKLARKVSHPNVCRIHEYGEDAGVSYISMALIEGTDLRRRLLGSPEGLPPEEAFDISIQVAEGLQAIHDVGIIHRDLKTPNIVLDPAGVVKLMDFGIAKESGRSGGITATGEVMGTPEYMSPEQCRGDKVDFRSDVYALGIVIYEVFTGRVPFHGETLMATLLKQLQEPPPLEGPAAAAIPPGVVGVLRKALAKEPDKRFVSSAELAQALRKARLEPAARPRDLFEPTRSLRPAEERRHHSRLEISVDVVLKRLSAGGAVMQEERTVADNIGRRGARVMTAMTGLAQGDSVVLQEVGHDFQAKAVVRYVYKPVDSIQRLGLEFLDRTAPDRLVPTDKDSGKSRIPRTAASVGDTPVRPPSPTDRSTPAFVDRRRTGRHSISVDVLLKRLDSGGEPVQEERTVADNIGRHGARVLTGMTDLAVGDRVSFKEVGSDFQTNAAVRNAFTGKDNIPRLGVEFLDRPAPDHLVPTYESQLRMSRLPAGPASQRPGPDPEFSTPTPQTRAGLDLQRLAARRQEILEAHAGLKSRNHFEVLGLPRASNAAQVKEAYVRLTKRFHPDAREPELQDLKREAEAVFLRIAEAYETLIHTERRSRYESALGRSTPRSMPPPPPAAAPAEPPPPPPAAPQPWGQDPSRDPDSDSRLAAQVLSDAKKLLGEEKYWDAIQMLEAALDLAKGGKVNHAIRILLARAISKNPKWLKRAEVILLSVIAEEPSNVEAYMVLGRLYGAAGLKGRAIVQYRRVLELHPRHAEASAELLSLDPRAFKRRGLL